MVQSELIQISFEKIMQTKAYTMVILGTQEKKFAIYLDPQIGKTMQLYLTDTKRARPLTHDLMGFCLAGFGIRLKQVVITELDDAVYFARLFLEQQIGDIRHIVEIDSRPSDALTLALVNDIPVFCTKEVLEETIEVDE